MFLLDYATLPEEDIKLNDTTFSWPDRILPIISYSEMRLRKKNEQVTIQLLLFLPKDPIFTLEGLSNLMFQGYHSSFKFVC